MAKKARNAKAAGKQKIGKKAALPKKASAKKPTPAKKAKKAAKKARVLKAAAPAPAGFGPAALAPAAAPPPPPKAVPPHDPEILAAVGECVDKFMDDAPHPGWSNGDKVTKFKYSPVSIVGLLTTVQACLLPKYQFTIPKNFAKKCTSDTETILQMKIDIRHATTRV
jgi:hypothetical protein